MDDTGFLAVHPDPVVQYVTRDGRVGIRRVNPAFERTFDADAAAVTLGDTLASDDVLATVAGAIRDGESVDVDAACETAAGSCTFRLRNVPAGDEGYLVYTDVGDRAETVARLRERTEHLEAFASAVSHDLRNPIEVARTYLGRARSSGEAADFERVETALGRMERLVGDVLALAREGRAIGETERVALAAVATDAWDRIDGHGTLTVRDETATLKADPDRLRQAVENLLRNGVEHGSPSSRAEPGDAVEHTGVTITVGALADGSGFYVEDDGPGIPPEERVDVFEPGVTAAEDGVGIGLAIVERIVAAHGWEITVTEGDGGGVPATGGSKADGREHSGVTGSETSGDSEDDRSESPGGARFEVSGVESFRPF